MEEDLVSRAGYRLTTIHAAGLHGVSLRKLPGNLLKIWQGRRAAQSLLADFKPDALFFTGGFVAAPVALASGNIPTVAFVPDIKPGFALRLVARFADAIALVADEAKQYFGRQERLRVTGYPVRKEMTRWSRSEAFAHFSLDKDLKTLLVFGGSKGARSINEALIQALPELLKEVQVLHVSGPENWDQMQAQEEELGERYHPFRYLHDDMGAALAAADLVLARAGASTIGEFPLFGLPGILVPIPMSGHIQHLNAAFMEKSGAALLLPDEQMSEKLSQLVLSTIHDEDRLARMSGAMRALGRQDAAKAIAQLIRNLGQAASEGTVAQ